MLKDFDFAVSCRAHGSQQNPLPQLHLLHRQWQLHQIDFVVLILQYFAGIAIATLVAVRLNLEVFVICHEEESSQYFIAVINTVTFAFNFNQARGKDRTFY